MTLERCQFCRSESNGIRYPDKSSAYYNVVCYNCGATGPFAKTPEEAAEKVEQEIRY